MTPDSKDSAAPAAQPEQVLVINRGLGYWQHGSERLGPSEGPKLVSKAAADAWVSGDHRKLVTYAKVGETAVAADARAAKLEATEAQNKALAEKLEEHAKLNQDLEARIKGLERLLESATNPPPSHSA